MKLRPVSTIIIFLASIVVIILAGLQYRWSNEMSEATSIRLADSLQMSMLNWHSEFLAEFSEICFTMGSPHSETANDLNQYERRYERWKSVTQNPDLIAGVYILKPVKSGRSHALRLDPTKRRFETAEWPAEFDKILDDFGQSGPPSSTGNQTSGAGNGLRGTKPDPQAQEFANRFYPAAPLANWRFEPTIPMLLRPIVTSVGIPSSSRYSSQETQDWIVIQLNRKVIDEHILPKLAQRYFQGTNGLDYQVAVVAGGPVRQTIYSSDPEFGNEEVRDADGRMDVFGRVQEHSLGSPIQLFRRPTESTVSAAFTGISWFPLFHNIPENQDWQLIVRHSRGGPLGAFAETLRRRNLAISFGVLFSLVVCVAMLIVASSRAQRLAKLQMYFVTAVSHELRTPLTVIRSAADNIADGVVEGKEQLAQYGLVIGDQARKLSGLVEQILTFRAVHEGNQGYQLRALNVGEIVDAALASTSEMLKEAQVVLEQEVAPNMPAVQGDLSALSRCLQNLITNALKYGGEQHWIGIQARAVEQNVDRAEVQISVEDRGIGIDSSDLAHIFDPFYRSPLVVAAQIHGTGLGLPLAKSIVEAMDGHLTVISARGRGSTFTLHLPALDPRPARRSEHSREPIDRNPH